MALVFLVFVMVFAPTFRFVHPPPPHHLRAPVFLGDPRAPAAYQMLLDGCQSGTCTVNASTLAAFSAMSAASISSSRNDVSGGAGGVPGHGGIKPPAVRDPHPELVSKAQQKAAVAATDLDAIDLEGGIEALLFLLEAAKKTKQVKEVAGLSCGEADTGRDAPDSSLS